MSGTGSKSKAWGIAAMAMLAVVAMGRHEIANAQTPDVARPLASLKSVRVPEPANLGDFVRDRAAAIALGKALFWDMQAGSDGIQACASCHFHAGADNRSINTVNPGGDATFRFKRPNAKLGSDDFPVHKLMNPDNRLSAVRSDSNDIVGSQGVFDSIFIDVTPGKSADRVAYRPDAVFNVNGVDTRRVTGRNTPSNINAVFNFRNFWDGRAQNDFNGVNPFGSRDPNAYVIKAVNPNDPQKVRIRLENSALASQACGPALSPFEMSGEGRIFQKIARKLGKKLQQLDPLAGQLVSPEDSVLGKHSRYPKPGINLSYRELIQVAFAPEWWNSNAVITIDASGEPVFALPPAKVETTDQYTLMEFNFSLFWGLAIQMYESTLVSDDTPFDRYMEGNSGALSAQEQKGLDLFRGRGKCSNCHGGAELTNASVSNVASQRLERMLMGDGSNATYDNGFYNIGVRPTAEDGGVGGSDPFGMPLSESRLAQLGLFVDPNGVAAGPGIRVVADGAFKAPALRNVELTAPYFHNGGQLTLRQVVEFYNRGGDFHETNIDNLDADVDGIGLTEDEKDALVAFLEALTDERVRFQAAPFDHPQLFIPNGHPGDENAVTDDGTGKATDQLLEIPMSGARGLVAPAANFLDPPG